MSADVKAIGTIEIEGASILTPEGGKVIDYRNKEELSDGTVYEAGQAIGKMCIRDRTTSTATSRATHGCPSSKAAWHTSRKRFAAHRLQC